MVQYSFGSPATLSAFSLTWMKQRCQETDLTDLWRIAYILESAYDSLFWICQEGGTPQKQQLAPGASCVYCPQIRTPGLQAGGWRILDFEGGRLLRWVKWYGQKARLCPSF